MRARIPWFGGGLRGCNVQDFEGWRGNISATSTQGERVFTVLNTVQLDGLPAEQKEAQLVGRDRVHEVFPHGRPRALIL